MSVHAGAKALAIEVQYMCFSTRYDEMSALLDPRRLGQGQTGIRLGLFVAREIVRAHGGDIDLVMVDSGHTVFRVALPRVDGGSRPTVQ